MPSLKWPADTHKHACTYIYAVTYKPVLFNGILSQLISSKWINIKNASSTI